MLELVIADDVTPPLTCPHCRRVYVRCSLRIPAGRAQCSGCGNSLWLPDLAWKKDGTASGATPPGLSVFGHGQDWLIEFTTRSPKIALLPLASGLGLGLFDVAHSLGWVAGREDPSWMLSALLIALSVALLACGAYMLWGRNSISAHDDVVTVFRGIAGIGSTQSFHLSEVNGVCLTTAINEKDETTHVIRVEGVGFYWDFGADLPDPLRSYTALFLLQNRLEQILTSDS